MKQSFLLFTFFSVNLFSQKLYHGLKFAPTINFDHTYVDTSYIYNTANGFKLGLSFEVDLDTSFSIVFEPAVDFRKNSFNRKISNSIYNFNDNVTWFEIPVFIRFKFGEKIKFITDIGISTQHIISYDNSTGYAGGNPIKISKSNYNSFLAFNYGIGVSKDYSASRLTVILRNRTAKNDNLYKANQMSLNFILAL